MTYCMYGCMDGTTHESSCLLKAGLAKLVDIVPYN